jgi:hypothetical protein
MSGAGVTAEIRRLIQTRADDRCEYCLIPALLTFLPLQVDHIVARKHGGQTIPENVALCCAVCNQHKGSDLSSIDPADGALVPLFHPRQNRGNDHFELRGLFITPKTATGRVTVRLLQLNSPERVSEREWIVTAGALKIPQ